VTLRPDLRDWLSILGDSSEIEKVVVYDDAAGKYITLIPEDPLNPIFALKGGEKVIVYAKVEKDISFGTILCADIDLKQGENMVGFACAPDGYTAHQLLNALGSENVSSTQRYNGERGVFETVVFDGNGQVTGSDFSIVAGEGYFIFMKQEVDGFQP